MKVSIDQYSAAWAKFLELIIFGQKSEALGMAKLLGHFMNDKILALQLQADLYLFFNEIQNAKELYMKVFELYAQNSLKNKSAAIHEHMKLF